MLGTVNIEHNLKLGLIEQGTPVIEIGEKMEEVNALFIDWMVKENPLYMKQAAIIEHYVKTGVPIVIFDRYLVLTQQEFGWLKKFNVSFLEPAVNNRPEFEYLPQWIKDRPEYKSFSKRPITLAYSGILSDRIKSFEKYYKEYASLFPSNKVCYSSETAQKKTAVWQDHNLEKSSGIEYGDVSFTILIGSLNEYRCGYIREDLWPILAKGCVPLLPIEHRFFGTVFKDLIVDGEDTVDYYVSCYAKIGPALVEEIYNNLLRIFPEFKINYAVDRIKSYV